MTVGGLKGRGEREGSASSEDKTFSRRQVGTAMFFLRAYSVSSLRVLGSDLPSDGRRNENATTEQSHDASSFSPP